jgi:hypothetical protein
MGQCSVVSANGTAMAASIVAGGLALVRQYFREGWHPSGTPTTSDAFTPSGALLKAMIVHAGKRMTGETKGNSSYPSVTQGFGRVDLSSVLTLGNSNLGRGLWVRSSKIGETRVELQQGQTFQKTFTLVTSGTFKVTLVWMDAPSPLDSVVNLVNDLDLRVLGLSTSYYPNGANSSDSLNNVEMIEINASPGSYSVIVTATELRSQPARQSYALVVTGPFDDGRTTTTTSTTTTSTTTTSTTTASKTRVAGLAFEKIAVGSCTQQGLFPISSVQACEDAAIQLGLAATIVTKVSSGNKPEGCFSFRQGTELFMSTNPANTGNGATGGFEPICSTEALSDSPPGNTTSGGSIGGGNAGRQGETDAIRKALSDNAAVVMIVGTVALVMVVSLIVVCVVRRAKSRPQRFAA